MTDNMIKPAFVPYKTEEERAEDTSITVTVRINKEDLVWLSADAVLLRQDKLTTVLKQLAYAGHLVLQEQKTAYFADTVFKNERRNERLGLREIKPQWGSP